MNSLSITVRIRIKTKAVLHKVHKYVPNIEPGINTIPSFNECLVQSIENLKKFSG